MLLHVITLCFIISLSRLFPFVLSNPALATAAPSDSLQLTLIRRAYRTNQPVTKLLRQLAERRPKLLRRLKEVRQPSTPYTKGATPPPACIPRQAEWARAARRFLSDQLLPLPNATCPYIESLSGRTANLSLSPPASSNLASFASNNFLDSGNFPGWPTRHHSFFMYSKERRSEIHQCWLNVDAVIEVGPPGRNAKRYFIALIRDVHPRDKVRNHTAVIEVVATDLSEPLLRRRDARNSNKPCNRTNCPTYSTVLEARSGAGSYSHFVPMQVHQVPLLDSTLEEDEDKFSVANTILEDLTPSNIAILALPLVLCFIPISPMADVSNFATLIYALITDLFSAVPLIIKGAELMIKFNLNPETSHSETWVFGDENIRLSETWTTHCRILISRGTGLIIVAIAVWAIVLGFVTEYLSWRYMSYKKKHKRRFAVLQDRNYIRKVGPDTYQVRSKYLAKMLDNTASTDLLPHVSTIVGTPAAEDESSADSQNSNVIVGSRASVGNGHADITVRSCAGDDQPLDVLPLRQSMRSSRMSSLLLRNSTLSEDDTESAEGPFTAFLLGVILGMLLPVFSYCYLHCLGSIERSRRRRKYYVLGCVFGFLLWVPILYLAQLFYVIITTTGG